MVKTLLSMLPILIGVLLLMSLLAQFLPRLMECGLFGMHPALDALVGMAAAFLYSRAVKIPLLPFMAHYFGSLYTVLFVVCIIVFSVVNGLIIQRLNH